MSEVITLKAVIILQTLSFSYRFPHKLKMLSLGCMRELRNECFVRGTPFNHKLGNPNFHIGQIIQEWTK